MEICSFTENVLDAYCILGYQFLGYFHNIASISSGPSNKLVEAPNTNE